MFVVLTYDVYNKRLSKVRKICRKYLYRAQNSVFEGKITEAKLNRLKNELKNIIDPGYDSVCVYKMESVLYTYKEEIGVCKTASNIIG